MYMCHNSFAPRALACAVRTSGDVTDTSCPRHRHSRGAHCWRQPRGCSRIRDAALRGERVAATGHTHASVSALHRARAPCARAPHALADWATYLMGACGHRRGAVGGSNAIAIVTARATAATTAFTSKTILPATQTSILSKATAAAASFGCR